MNESSDTTTPSPPETGSRHGEDTPVHDAAPGEQQVPIYNAGEDAVPAGAAHVAGAAPEPPDAGSLPTEDGTAESVAHEHEQELEHVESPSTDALGRRLPQQAGDQSAMVARHDVGTAAPGYGGQNVVEHVEPPPEHVEPPLEHAEPPPEHIEPPPEHVERGELPLEQAELPMEDTLPERSPRESAVARREAAVDLARRPLRRPRFRERPRNWWLLALTGQYATEGGPPFTSAREASHAPSAATSAHPPAVERVFPPAETDEASTQVAPAPAGRPPAGTIAPASVAPPVTRQRRTTRAVIAVAACLIIVGIVISRILAPPASTTAPSATPTTSVTFNPGSGPSLTALATLGTAAGLSAPREAVTLPDGRVAVADTGNNRVVLLSATGKPLQIIYGGVVHLLQPFAVAVTGGGFAVLDPQRGGVELFSTGGRFVRELIHSPVLVDGRGMAAGPDGTIYVANPRANAIVVISPQGALVRQISSALGNGAGQFNQPSDVAIGPDGLLYVVDNQNNRIEALTPAGSFVRQWPAPPSDTFHSVHVLPLSHGRLVASDPSGALLVYGPRGGPPIREPLRAPGQAVAPAQPLGLSPAPHGRLMVVDAMGNQLLIVPAP